MDSTSLITHHSTDINLPVLKKIANLKNKEFLLADLSTLEASFFSRFCFIFFSEKCVKSYFGINQIETTNKLNEIRKKVCVKEDQKLIILFNKAIHNYNSLFPYNQVSPVFANSIYNLIEQYAPPIFAKKDYSSIPEFKLDRKVFFQNKYKCKEKLAKFEWLGGKIRFIPKAELSGRWKNPIPLYSKYRYLPSGHLGAFLYQVIYSLLPKIDVIPENNLCLPHRYDHLSPASDKEGKQIFKEFFSFPYPFSFGEKFFLGNKKLDKMEGYYNQHYYTPASTVKENIYITFESSCLRLVDNIIKANERNGIKAVTLFVIPDNDWVTSFPLTSSIYMNIETVINHCEKKSVTFDNCLFALERLLITNPNTSTFKDYWICQSLSVKEASHIVANYLLQENLYKNNIYKAMQRLAYHIAFRRYISLFKLIKTP
ncbi:MAG: hypothetical protein BGO10_06285 [Chlamydia sp. 32-24]|nr:MAG: hypothetical protein BGO10_06285 [Chlamydia sp. 32-24]